MTKSPGHSIQTDVILLALQVIEKGVLCSHSSHGTSTNWKRFSRRKTIVRTKSMLWLWIFCANFCLGITDLFLRASNLHLHLSAFFDDPSTKDYRERLLSLYVATTSFLEVAMKLETEVGPVLSYAPYYIYQMMVAAGCTLLKLGKSFFAAHIDMEYTKNLFNRTIWAVRGVSVSSNDLPERLAEVLAQMWRLSGSPQITSASDVDDSLRLRVRCRMSMSLLYDSVWRWREDARTKGRNIEGLCSNSQTVFYRIMEC